MSETVLASCGHYARLVDLRRGMCDPCYRKLKAAGCPLPPCGSRWDDYDALAAWARSLPAETRARLLLALGATSTQSVPRREPVPA